MHNPAHPGEVLREFLPESLSVSETARRLGVSRVQLSRLLNGRAAMTAEMAIRIALFTNTSAESWLKNQMQWDLWQAEQRPRPNVKPFDRAA
jgi:addiction module HigA family antidote